MSTADTSIVVALFLLVVLLGAAPSVWFLHRRRVARAGLVAADEPGLGTEARLHAIIDSSLDAIVTTDSASVITGWSRQAERIFGWTAEAAVGLTLSDTIIPPQHREAHRRGIRHFLATGEGPILNRRIEITALRRDGSEFPVELTVSAAGSGPHLVFTSFIRDITERRQLEARLAAENAVTRALAESQRLSDAAPRVLAALGETLGWSFGGFWSVNAEGREIACEATWCAPGIDCGDFAEVSCATRFAAGEGLPGRVWESGSPIWVEDVAADARFPRAARAAESGLHGALAFPVRTSDQMLAVIEFFHPEPLPSNPALLELMAAVGSDIGQAILRIRAEEERDRALEELRRTNERLRERTQEAEAANQAKSDFLATMSHELRTPLNAIVGFADLMTLGIGGDLTDEQRRHLERIRASSDHLLSLIDDVLDLSRIDAGRMRAARATAQVGQVVAEALSMVTPQATERGVELVNACDDAEVTYLGDEDRVRQILLNLLSNAVKFTPHGGRVTVRCDAGAVPAGGEPLSGPGPWSRIQVEDTGIGIAADNQAAVFDPFVQVETGKTRAYGGTGLGLTISRRLARLMGGDLTLRSDPGRGSCFTLWLPGRDVEREAVAVAPAAAPVDPAQAGLAQAGEALRAELDAVLGAVSLRLRADPRVPGAREMGDAELQDHQLALLSDLVQTLVMLGRGASEETLRDGGDVQRLISVRHGMQRARYGWREEELHREFEVLGEELEAAVRRTAPRPEEAERAVRVLSRLVRRCLEVSLRGYAARQASPPERPPLEG